MQVFNLNGIYRACPFLRALRAAGVEEPAALDSAEVSPFFPTPPEKPQPGSLARTGQEAAIGQMSGLSLLFNAARYLHNPANFFGPAHAKHGPTFAVDCPVNGRILFETRQEAVLQALNGTDSERAGSAWTKSARQAHGLSFLVGSDNIFLGRGKTWEESRAIIRPYLSGNRILQEDVMSRVATLLDGHLDALEARVRGGEREVDLWPVMQSATFDVAMDTLFGARLSESVREQALDAFETVGKWVSRETLNPSSVSLSQMGARDLKHAYGVLKGLADDLIEQRVASGERRDDVLDGLLQAGFDRDRVRNEVLTLMLAGHETTAALLSWSFGFLARNPEAQKALRAEVDGLKGRTPSREDMLAMDQAQRVLKETLRLETPTYFLAREATEDTDLAGVFCPKGTTLVMGIHEMGRDEDTWGIRNTGFPAHEFHPDRFESSSESVKRFNFGGGTRFCPGFALARMESTTMLARMLQRFELEDPGQPLERASDISVHPREATVRLKLRPPAASST